MLFSLDFFVEIKNITKDQVASQGMRREGRLDFCQNSALSPGYFGGVFIEASSITEDQLFSEEGAESKLCIYGGKP